MATGRVFVRKVMGSLRLTKDGWWVPRSREVEKVLEQSQLDAAQKQFNHRAPHWHGEMRPPNMDTVSPRTQWPDVTLCKRLGQWQYPDGALLAFAVRGHSPIAPPAGDKRKATANGSRAIVDVQHPYVPAAPGKRTKHSSVITKQQFLVAVVHMRLGSQNKAAFEVVVKGRPVPAVAKRHRLNRRTLEDTVYRVRQRVRQFIF